MNTSQSNKRTDPGTYIRFVEGSPKPKTRTWWVVTRDDDVHLGSIGWFGRWRKYAFWPKPNTVYEEICLRDIADFCVSQTTKHREASEAKKKQP